MLARLVSQAVAQAEAAGERENERRAREAVLLNDARSAELTASRWRDGKGQKRSNAAMRAALWLVGKSLRLRGDPRASISELLSVTPLGHMWTVAQCVLSVAVFVLYVAQTYAYADGKAEPWFDLPVWVEFVAVGFIAVDYTLLFFAAEDKWAYPLGFTAVIDVLCVAPIVFKFSPAKEWLDDLLLGELFTGLYFLRILRTKRLVTVGRLYWKFLADEVNASIAEFILNFVALVLIGSGLFYTVEQELYPILSDERQPRSANPDVSYPHLYYHDCIYFIIVTTSTVGFGDISPSTQLGRVLVSGIIGIGIITIPMSVRNILDLINKRSMYRTTYLPDADANMRHVIFAGTHYNNAVILQRFTKELYHPDRASSFDVDRTLLVVGPDDPDDAVKQLLESALLRSKAQFVRGTLMQEEDLLRFAAHDAKACFILAHKQAKDVRKEDDAALIRALVVSNFCPRIRIFMQVLQPSRIQDVDGEQGVETLQCVGMLKMEIIAAACNCLGINALLDNLVTCLGQPDDQRGAAALKPWKIEYMQGTGREVYEVKLTDEIVGLAQPADPKDRSTILMGGMTWEALLLLVVEVSRGACALLGIVVDGVVCMHPGMSFVVPEQSGIVLIVIADDYATADMLLNPKIYRRHHAFSIRRRVACAPMRPFLPMVPGHDYVYATGKDDAHARVVPIEGGGTGVASGGQGLTAKWRKKSLMIGRGAMAGQVMRRSLAAQRDTDPQVGHSAFIRAKIGERVDDAAATGNDFGAARPGFGLVEVDDARAFNLRGHIVITGSMQNVVEMVHKLRLHEMNGTILHKPLVLLVPRWGDLAPADAVREGAVLDALRGKVVKYRDLFLVRGDPSSHKDLARAALETSTCCALLSDRRDLIEIDGDSLSVRTIFTYLSIEQFVQSRLVESKMRDFYVVVDLGSKSTMRILNSKCLARDRGEEATETAEGFVHDGIDAAIHQGWNAKDAAAMLFKRSGTRARSDVTGAHLIEFFAAGYGMSSDMFDSLLTQCYFCKSLIETFEQLVGHGSSVSCVQAGFQMEDLVEKRAIADHRALVDKASALEETFGAGSYKLSRPVQLDIPSEFHRAQWGVLYHHLVSVERVVPLGLYRSEIAAGPLSPADLPYVYTCPTLDTIVHRNDRAIVVVRLDNPLLRRTAKPLNTPSRAAASAAFAATPSANGAAHGTRTQEDREPSKAGDAQAW